jgi:hypothetical protein
MGLRLEGRERRGEGSRRCGGRRDWGGVVLQRSNEEGEEREGRKGGG